MEVRVDCTTLPTGVGGFTKPDPQVFPLAAPTSTGITETTSDALFYWMNQKVSGDLSLATRTI